MIDAHCHLDSMADPDGVVKETKAARIRALVTCGYDLDSSRKSLDLAKRFEYYVFPVVGVGPQYAMSMPNRSWEMEVPDEAVAVGEIGLDYHWASTTTQRQLQKECFEHYLKLAIETDLPVVIHCRDAWPEAISVLKEHEAKGVILHHFSGTLDDAKVAVEMGWAVSLPPNPSAVRKRVAAELDATLLVESDAPAVGKSPLDIQKAVDYIAAAKKKTQEEISLMTEHNTIAAFRLVL